jgi:hypothetical protein
MTDFKKTEMSTLSECINMMTKQGYTENFKAKATGLVALSNDKLFVPEEVKIVNFFRFEGDSNPSDNSILYVIETNDGTKGLLADAYGADTNEDVSKFVQEVENFTKKKHKDV